MNLTRYIIRSSYITRHHTLLYNNAPELIAMEGEGAMGEDAGWAWLTVKAKQILHPSQTLINRTPWVAVYPAFFVNPFNVYQSLGGSRLGRRLWSGTTTLQRWLSLGSTKPVQSRKPYVDQWVENSHPHLWGVDAAMSVRGRSHAGRQCPCDGPDTHDRRAGAIVIGRNKCILCSDANSSYSGHVNNVLSDNDPRV